MKKMKKIFQKGKLIKEPAREIRIITSLEEVRGSSPYVRPDVVQGHCSGATTAARRIRCAPSRFFSKALIYCSQTCTVVYFVH